MSDRLMGLVRLRATLPVVPPRVVRRPRLERRLGDRTGGVVLVSAGPGAGKTLAVASRLAGFDGAAAAWLTVDESDNDPRAFWSDVLAALDVGGVPQVDSPLRDLSPASTFGASQALQVRAGWRSCPDRWCWSWTTCTSSPTRRCWTH